MPGKKRKAEELEADEAEAENELKAVIAAANAADSNERVEGLTGPPAPGASGTAPIYFNVPGISPPPWDNYPGTNSLPKAGEKPLVFVYFAIRGLGEVTRLLLAEAGAAYEHIAITGGEEQAHSLQWRKRSPNGLLPMMSGLGVPRCDPICQSSAIVRYLARKYNMAGANELEAARIDNLFETAKDLADNKSMITGEAEMDANAAKQPAALAVRIEDMLAEMGSAGEDSAIFNYGQIQLLHVLMSCEEAREGCVRRLSPALDEFRKAGAERPRIRTYLKSGMRFPLTAKESGNAAGGYKYPSPIAREDFAKIPDPETSQNP